MKRVVAAALVVGFVFSAVPAHAATVSVKFGDVFSASGTSNLKMGSSSSACKSIKFDYRVSKRVKPGGDLPLMIYLELTNYDGAVVGQVSFYPGGDGVFAKADYYGYRGQASMRVCRKGISGTDTRDALAPARNGTHYLIATLYDLRTLDEYESNEVKIRVSN